MNYDNVDVTVDWTKTTVEEEIQKLIKSQMVLSALVTNMLLTYGEHILKDKK